MNLAKNNQTNNRQLALEVIFSVVVLKKSLNDFDFQGNSFAALLSFGTIRFYHQLNYIVQPLLRQEFKKEDLDIFCILLLGAYQLLHEDNPTYAVVNESVNLVGVSQKYWAKGLINAVLRKIITLRIPEHTSHPKWLEKKIKKNRPGYT